jgi:hypothetical protein
MVLLSAHVMSSDQSARKDSLGRDPSSVLDLLEGIRMPPVAPRRLRPVVVGLGNACVRGMLVLACAVVFA